MYRSNAALYFTYGVQLERVHASLFLCDKSPEAIGAAREELINILCHIVGEVSPTGEQPAPAEMNSAMNPLILASARQLLNDAKSDSVPFGDLTKPVANFQNLLSRALLEPMFFVIPRSRRPYYEGTSLFGPEVDSIFPECIRDIAEAGKCLALARWTATVFHLMRVLEIGLRKLALELGVKTPPDELMRKTMGEVLKECRTALHHGMQSGRFKKDDRDFYDGALAFLESSKNAWRNHVDHGMDHYTEENAIETFNSTRSFLRRLVQKP
jgi:hypothetical protein